MAEIVSREAALANGTTGGSKMKAASSAGVRASVITGPATAAWAQNDTWSTGIRIPKGSRILRSGRLSHAAFGAGTTLDVGIRGADSGTVIDVDGIADGLDIAAAGVKELDGGSLFAAGVAYTTTEDVEVYASLLTANPTDNAQMELEIHFLPSAS